MIGRSARAALIAGALAVAAPAAAQVEVFEVQGSNLGSHSVDYTGQVGVQKTGDTWQIEWRVGGPPIRATGIIMGGRHLAASGMFEGKPSVFMMRTDGARFVGEWAAYGATRVGREVWTPQ